MHARTAAAPVLLALTLALTGCSSGDDTKADVASCKTVMRKQYKDAIAAGDKATPGTRPSECVGVDDKTLQKLVGDLMSEQIGKAVESAMPDATEPTDITAECRAWIEKELQDDSDSIDATPGEDACGYMSKDELDQAIDTVTDDLIQQDATPAS